MCRINLKQQFDVRFMIKAPIFSRQAFNMFLARSVLESTYYLFRKLAIFSYLFSAIVFHSTIETGLHSLYRKKVITAFDRNNNNKKNSLGPGTRFREKTMICLF